MNKKIGILVVVLLIAIASGIVIKDYYSYKHGEEIAGDITSLKDNSAFPVGHGYSYYIKESNFKLLSAEQKRHIAATAFVVNDKFVDQVSRLKEFAPADDATGTQGVDSSGRNIAALNKDTLQIEKLDNKEISGYVDLSEDRLLLFPVPYHREWQIDVDVTTFPPIVVNSDMMGVFVEKGRHHINLHYSPRYIYRDLIAILIALVIFTGTWIITRQKANAMTLQKMRELESMFYNRKLYTLLAFLAIPVIIYFYFLKWRTNTAYGDDLYVFHDYTAYHTYWERLTLHLGGAKYRPVHDFALGTAIELFKKDLTSYFLFNIAVQTAIAYAFALTLNLFFRSMLLSLGFSLVVALSRFSFFNITQITFGGPLEGIAFAFFLYSLFFILRVVCKHGISDKEKKYSLLWSFLFANLALYTHERYIVLFPFIAFVAWFSLDLQKLKKTTKIIVCAAAAFSIFLNVVLKTFVYHMPFFMGTGNVEMKFSFSAAFSFLMEGILSILLINTGPEYLGGAQFSALPGINKAAILLVVCFVLLLFAFYIFKVLAVFFRYCLSKVVLESALKPKSSLPNMGAFIFLFVLFFLSIMPAIVTIRLEQRWLQAPFAVFILMVAAAFDSLPFKSTMIRNYAFSLFVIVFIWLDYSYLNAGGNSTYMKHAEVGSNLFWQARKDGTIAPTSSKLYIWNKQKEPNSENDLTWSIGHCYFFEFYYDQKVEIAFVDSVYQDLHSSRDTTLVHFNKNTDQLIYIKYAMGKFRIVDLTDEFLKDSLKSFEAGQAN